LLKFGWFQSAHLTSFLRLTDPLPAQIHSQNYQYRQSHPVFHIDEQKALQCVKRLRVAQQQVNLLEQQYQQSTAQEAKVRDDLSAISEQLWVSQTKKYPRPFSFMK
jgi:phage shock protein A